MNRLLLLLAALALVAGGVQAALPAASPDGDLSIRAETPADGVPITDCTVITGPGTYYLARSLSDLDCPVAISVRSSDVVIDGRNYSIEGRNLSGTIGIEIRPPESGTAVTNVRVTNVRLSGCETGLVVAPALSEIPESSVQLTGVHAASNRIGFRLWGPGNLTLEDCTAESNDWYGIRADGITGDLTLALTDVLVQANGDTGIDARLTGITMNNCRVRDNGWSTAETSGFRFDKGSAIVRDSLFEQNRGAGIFLEYATNGTITGSTIRYNGIGIRDANSAGEGTVNVYDNYFLNERNVALDSQVDTWSVPKQVGPNIVGGPSVGGNFWAAPNGTGFSEIHPDADGDGFCDEPYGIDGGNVDLVPLAIPAGPAVVAVPGGVGLPADIGGDGLYEDVNGNGRADCADVVLYFNQMTWIVANEPVSAFDYNDNGRVDFADIVRLFANL